MRQYFKRTGRVRLETQNLEQLREENHMTENNDPRTSQQSTATVQSGLMGHLIQPGPEHKLLEVFIGKWMNEGQTIAGASAPAVKILTSDVYEWMPGGFFVLHTAYGRIGNMGVGGTEILGYDAASKQYRSHFFDSQGHIRVYSSYLHRSETLTNEKGKVR